MSQFFARCAMVFGGGVLLCVIPAICWLFVTRPPGVWPIVGVAALTLAFLGVGCMYVATVVDCWE